MSAHGQSEFIGDVKALVAVVLPVYNEEHGIIELLDSIASCIEQNIVFVLVDDGSEDNSFERIYSYRPPRDGIEKVIVRLSRNFGHQAALMAGIHSVPEYCEKIVVMDADHQDQPRDIPLLLEKLVNGVSCAYAVRLPKAQNQLINILTHLFYIMQRRLAGVAIPSHAGTFSAIDRRFLSELKKFEEKDIYFPGLRALVGYSQVPVFVERAARKFSISRVGLCRLFSLGLSGILGFSVAPTRLILVAGLMSTAVCILLAVLVLFLWATGVVTVVGYTSLALFVLGLFGVQLVCTGVVGEYIGRIFLETKGRPRWVVHSCYQQSFRSENQINDKEGPL